AYMHICASVLSSPSSSATSPLSDGYGTPGAAKRVDDLFLDLQDGYNLIALLEVLSGETLPREKGFTRFHRIQNVQYCLDFLKTKKIKTVNIRPEDIVEGNPKLTLGLIWTIILHFQVSASWQQKVAEAAAASAA
uniref:Calponin-homology (CH) domain-containing protein n=1 Tax=Plectus sambesii TaxID=2011161 RepID=A0A914V3B1_9BILA